MCAKPVDPRELSDIIDNLKQLRTDLDRIPIAREQAEATDANQANPPVVDAELPADTPVIESE